MTRWDEELQTRSPVLRYGFSLVCVGVALGLALAAQYYGFRDVGLPLFSLAIAIVTWYAGVGPSVLTVLLSTLFFDYFFVEPLHSLAVSLEDIPYFVIFVAWAIVVASFAAVRRRIEENLRRAQEDLAHRAAELEATNKELESFTYSVSHDLRAPLRAINGFSSALLEDYGDTVDPGAKALLRRVITGAERMGHIIDALLSLARLSTFELHPETVDLAPMARSILEQLRAAEPERSVELVAPQAVIPCPPRMTPIASGLARCTSAMSRPSWKPGRRHGTHTTRPPKQSRVSASPAVAVASAIPASG